MRIAEIYQSIQGEGVLTGTPSIFVRASGCNLRCWFCDTPFASWSPEGNDLSVEEIIQQVREFSAEHVVITGGEPMLFSELIPLTQQLRDLGQHITIETAGTLQLQVDCDLMSISPKFASSAPDAQLHPRWHQRHLQSRHRPEVIRHLIQQYDYQIKFVIDRDEDLREVDQWLDEFPQVVRERVLLMPQGIEASELESRTSWLVQYCAAHQFTFCPRKHVEWFGMARGT
jgi:7-carboxy-7-deazaguanine synthase